MKIKILIMAVILLSTLIITSCKKDGASKEYCVSCTITQTETVTGSSPTVFVVTTDYCGVTNQDIDLLLKNGNITTTASLGGFTVITKTETTCKKK